jgi:septin 7
MADSYYEPNGQEPTGAADIEHDAYEHAPTNGGVSPVPVSPNGHSLNASPSPNGSALPATNGNGSVVGTPAVVRKTLSSWVGFSNLPNQVHRRSVR